MDECVVAMKEQIKRIEFLKKRMEDSFNSSFSISGISSVVSFTTQKFLVFRSKGDWKKEYLKCCTTWIFSYLINAGLLEFTVKFLHLNVFIAQFVSTFAAAVFTYVLFKKFAFRVKHQQG